MNMSCCSASREQILKNVTIGFALFSILAASVTALALAIIFAPPFLATTVFASYAIYLAMGGGLCTALSTAATIFLLLNKPQLNALPENNKIPPDKQNRQIVYREVKKNDLSPYTLIKLAASSPLFFQSLLQFQKVCDTSLNKAINEQSHKLKITPMKLLLSNCGTIAESVFAMFVGLKKATLLVNRLSMPALEIKTEALQIHGILDGPLLHTLSSHPEFLSSDDKRFAELFTSCAKEFLQTHSDLDLSQMLNLSQINKEHILTFWKEILDNEGNISSTKSKIYIIRIGDQTELQHACVVEAFYEEKTKTVKYRIYQSWITHASLGEDLSNNSLHKEDGLSSPQLYFIFEKLSDFFSLLTKTAPTLAECFGYTEQRGVRNLAIYQKGNVIKAMSFRYLAQEIDPKKVAGRLKKWVTKDTSLTTNLPKSMAHLLTI